MNNRYNIIEFDTEPQYTAQFISLPGRLYENDEKWVPSMDTFVNFLNGKHPFNKFLEHKNYLVECSGHIVGRASAFINRSILIKGRPLGSIGFFECENDKEAAALLIANASYWIERNDAAVIWAPMDGTIWNSYRFMIRGFEDFPFPGEPYNKPYYPVLFEQCGFNVLKKWLSDTISPANLKGLLEHKEKNFRRVSGEGYRFRTLNEKKKEKEFLILYELLSDSFSDFLGFHKLDFHVFMESFEGIKQLLRPEFTFFAENPEGKPVGFYVLLPNYCHTTPEPDPNCISNTNNGINSIIGMYIGITREEIEKNHGLGGALMYTALGEACKLNVPIVHALVAEGSLSAQNFKYTDGNLHEYCLYSRDV